MFSFPTLAHYGRGGGKIAMILQPPMEPGSEVPEESFDNTVTCMPHQVSSC